MALSRRRLLKSGALLAVLVGAPSWTLLHLRGSAPPVGGLRVLSDHHHRTFAAMAAVHIPKGGAFAIGAADFDLARLFDAFLADESAADQSDARRALDLLEFGPLLFDRGTTTFSHLADADRLAHWSGWSTSSLAVRREVFWSLSRFLGMAFYDQQQVWPTIGYQGPSLARLGRNR